MALLEICVTELAL